MSTLKIIKYQDNLKHYKQLLEDCTEALKKVRSDYQNYLKDNLFKEQKRILEQRKTRYTEKILAIIEMGYEEFDERKLNKIK